MWDVSLRLEGALRRDKRTGLYNGGYCGGDEMREFKLLLTLVEGTL